MSNTTFQNEQERIIKLISAASRIPKEILNEQVEKCKAGTGLGTDALNTVVAQMGAAQKERPIN